MMETILLDHTRNDEWNAFVQRHPRGTLFHETRWLDLCATYQKAKLHRLGFVADGALVGIFPFYVKRFGPLKAAASPFVVENTPYMGPLALDTDAARAIVPALDDFLTRMRINFSRIILQGGQAEWGFVQRGYKETVRHTHVLDLSPGLDHIWAHMEGRARTAIRKSEKSGVRCAFEDTPAVIDEYVKLATAIYQRQGKLTPHPKGFYRDICFGPLARNAKLVSARLDGELIAGAIFVTYNGWLYYLDAVSDKEHNALCAPSGVQSFILQWAVGAGLQQYDFVGSDMPWIARFKASFGGTLCEYAALEKAAPAWVLSLRKFYGGRLRPFIQKVRTTIDTASQGRLTSAPQ